MWKISLVGTNFCTLRSGSGSCVSDDGVVEAESNSAEYDESVTLIFVVSCLRSVQDLQARRLLYIVFFYDRSADGTPITVIAFSEAPNTSAGGVESAAFAAVRVISLYMPLSSLWTVDNTAL